MTIDEAREQEGVLEAFAAAHPVPTAKAIAEHCRDHPRHAAAIRELASLLLETELFGRPDRGGDGDDREADERDVGAVVRAMGGLHDDDADRTPDLQDLLDRTGRPAEAVFERIGFTGVAARRLVDGRLSPPLPAELVAAMAMELDVTEAGIIAALDASVASPRMGMAKASGGAPVQRGFAETVRASDMDDARKAYWLGKA